RYDAIPSSRSTSTESLGSGTCPSQGSMGGGEPLESQQTCALDAASKSAGAAESPHERRSAQEPVRVFHGEIPSATGETSFDAWVWPWRSRKRFVSISFCLAA